MSVSPVPMVRMHRRPPPMSDVVCVHMQAMTAPTKLRFGARVQFHAHGALDLDGVAIRTPSFQRMGIAPLPCVRHDGISHEEVPYGYLSTASNFFDSHCEHHGSVSAPLACFPEATMTHECGVDRQSGDTLHSLALVVDAKSGCFGPFPHFGERINVLGAGLTAFGFWGDTSAYMPMQNPRAVALAE